MMLVNSTQEQKCIIRGTSLHGIEQLFEKTGVLDLCLYKHCIDKKIIGKFSDKLSYKQFANLLQELAITTNNMSFGMQLASHQKLLALGPMRYLAITAPSIPRAIKVLLDYHHLYSDATKFNYELNDDYFTVEMLFNSIIATPQATEKALLHAKLLVEELSGKICRPEKVMFRHAPQGTTWSYHKYFDTTVSFKNSRNAIFFNLKDIEAPAISSDPILHDMVNFYFTSHKNTKTNEFQLKTFDISNVMRPFLAHNRCTIELVSRELGVSTRTLQRSLERNGATFEQCLDSLRKDIAEELVLKTRMSIDDISKEVGYRQSTSFCRAYKRWFGCSPLQHRLIII
ncbi:AraC family transcriptional regulator [Citrobacter koseri]|uniref:AraC family transcriptional regulator n=1 Tax=Citrobacter koseri TaxID=545 RepID=UPI0023AFC40A|nr:AraC family transcriptional regulator [Citrobacter koseri]